MDEAGQGMSDPARLLAHPIAGCGFGDVGGFMTHPGAGCPWRPQEHWAGARARGGIRAALWNPSGDIRIQSPWKAQGYLPVWNEEDEGNVLGAGGRKSAVPCW